MKKITVLFAIIFTFLVLVMSSSANSVIKLYINNKLIDCDVAPVISNNRTLVPARVVFENLNAEVEWQGATQQVVITSGATTIVFTLGSTVAVVNGNPITMDCAPLVVQQRTLVPIRFVSETLGYDVKWDGASNSVYISSPQTMPQTKPQLLSVSVKSGASGNQVQIALSEGIEPKIMVLKNPYRICLDFGGAVVKNNDSKQNVDNEFIKQVRWANHADYARVVVECPSEQKYTVSGKGTTAVVVTVGDTPAVQKPQITPVKLTNIVVIDAGHGGSDPGAVYRDEDGNVVLAEKDVNLYVAQKIRDYLTADGIKVVMTRDSDTYTGTEMENLLARANVANNVDASLFLSVHSNSASSPKATGTEVCYTPNSSGAYGVTSMEFAKNIITPLVNATGLTNRGLSSRPNLAVLKYTQMPAVLIECAFISCETDRKVLMNKSKLDEVAKAVAVGIKTTLKQMNN